MNTTKMVFVAGYAFIYKIEYDSSSVRFYWYERAINRK